MVVEKPAIGLTGGDNLAQESNPQTKIILTSDCKILLGEDSFELLFCEKSREMGSESRIDLVRSAKQLNKCTLESALTCCQDSGPLDDPSQDTKGDAQCASCFQQLDANSENFMVDYEKDQKSVPSKKKVTFHEDVNFHVFV